MKNYLFYIGHLMFNQLSTIINAGEPSICQLKITPIDVYSNKKTTITKALYEKILIDEGDDLTLFLHYDNKADYYVLANMYKAKNVENIILLNPSHDKNIYKVKNGSKVNIFAVNNKNDCAKILSVLLNWELCFKRSLHLNASETVINDKKNTLPWVRLQDEKIGNGTELDKQKELISRLKLLFAELDIPIDELNKCTGTVVDGSNIMRITLESKIETIFLILFALIISCCIALISLCIKLYLALNKRDPVCTPNEINSCPMKRFENCSKQFDTCLICMEPFQNVEPVRELLCGHYYHSPCIDPWLKSKSARCPYCRTLMKQSV